MESGLAGSAFPAPLTRAAGILSRAFDEGDVLAEETESLILDEKLPKYRNLGSGWEAAWEGECRELGGSFLTAEIAATSLWIGYPFTANSESCGCDRKLSMGADMLSRTRQGFGSCATDHDLDVAAPKLG